MRFGIRARFLAIAGLLTMAACAAAPPPPPPLPPADPAAACLQGLDQRHIQYDRIKDWKTPEGCGVDGAVRIKQSAIAWNRSVIMACQLSGVVWDFETKVVQTAAQRNFGRSVRKMLNAGSYDCRGERGGRAERLSQHSFGRAFDVTGFELDDGTVISVLRDWRSQGPKADFLHQVAQGACQMFNLVLTPNRNAAHHDHLHLDIGPYKLCGN